MMHKVMNVDIELYCIKYIVTFSMMFFLKVV